MYTHKSLGEYSDILRPKDVREILGIGWNRTYKLLSSGEIKNFRVGRSIRIPKIYLFEYLKKMCSSDT